MLGYFYDEDSRHKHRHGSPLISRAMKAALMADEDAIGNDEPRNR